MTKYCTVSLLGTVDNKRTLGPEDDAARANMGGDWRMPTQDELQELVDNTTNEWITDYNGTGVNGRKFTSKTNGNSIFIPASGNHSGSSFYCQGNSGYVWSSSLNSTYPDCAWNLYFDSGGFVTNRDDIRKFGFVVRGVME